MCAISQPLRYVKPPEVGIDMGEPHPDNKEKTGWGSFILTGGCQEVLRSLRTSSLMYPSFWNELTVVGATSTHLT